MVHVGVDLHKAMSQIAVLSEDGEVLQRRLENDPPQLEAFFAQLPPGTPVAIEASGTWWWLVDLLDRLGHRAVLSHPKQTKAVAAARLKNDRVDALRLGLLLRGDLLPTVWIPPAELREARELVRHRVQLMWLRGIVRNRLLAMLARRNLRPTATKSWLSAGGQRELQQLPLAAGPSHIRTDCQRLLPVLDTQIRGLDVELVARWGRDPRVQRLRTIPGIGPFIAIVLVLELGEIARFPSAKHLASYIGLTPRVRASADRVRTGHISKEGNRLLRWVLVLAATQAVRRPGPLRAWFHAVKRRKGRQIARVALARRLAEIVFHVWRHDCDYFTVLRHHGAVRG
ncbi:MAG TPA: IS110 family transposase [Methylomirabilota bacterium]|nr:IS110 family transposase [Methylomirabilota bacterium]